MAKWNSPASPSQAAMRAERLEKIKTLLRELRHEIYCLNTGGLAEDEQSINAMLEQIDAMEKRDAQR